jgi:RimJ/RimL family protein N-acetyltransferase
VSELLSGEGFVLRRATLDDVDFIAELASHEDVEPFMAAVSARDPEGLTEEIERSEREPELLGRYVIEVDGERAGAMAFEVANRRSKIADLRGLMIAPEFRGRGLADGAAQLLVRHLFLDLDYHRVQLECYGFNERAIRHAKRAGFRHEGVRRHAYRRHGEWVDGVLFGLVREDWE